MTNAEAFLRRTKIVATLGPATDDPAVLEAMVRAGLDVARVNFSHGGKDEQRRRIVAVREAGRKVGRSVGILADLSGPKIRIESFEKGKIDLAEGQPFALDIALDPSAGNEREVGCAYKNLVKDVRAGDTLLLADGYIVLEVVSVSGTRVECITRAGGELSNRKGLNKQGGGLSAPALTDKDLEYIQLAADAGVDFLAVSFARDAADIRRAQVELRKHKGTAHVVAKIERHEAIDNLSDILSVADAVMVARGDLGVEMGHAALTGMQKTIIQQAQLANRIVITATQMMESMIHSPVPTRAEVSDVANAVLDGTDAVMLSAESAVGAYPVEAVAMMNRIIERTEEDHSYRAIIEALDPEPEPNAADAISEAAAQVATTISAAAIVTFTTSGSTALRAGRRRPRAPILLLTSRLSTARRFVLLWGAHSVQTEDISSLAEMVEKATSIARQESFARSGSKLVITAGVPFGTPGATNVLRIAWVE